ncbi:DNA-directed RNA polymerase III subunit rpc6-like isoform 1 [Corchorus olitorius]|uniref:DNA-directed RNA polymerase III subunit rpc6-like isoform 1 n=1 Tax=Corchorus olitorius TaxID=93759 RepID=A0A1R3IDC5_9ROSI|nr:DNA-directed RNA polymerase III subunit rpc6-like isoform 1 [Corchorus olitorius]
MSRDIIIAVRTPGIGPSHNIPTGQRLLGLRSRLGLTCGPACGSPVGPASALPTGSSRSTDEPT